MNSLRTKFAVIISLIYVLLFFSAGIAGARIKISPVNLSRLSIARVSASSVNGGRPLSNLYYGIRNAFDEGLNDVDGLPYSSWLTDQPPHWVNVRFTEPVELSIVIVEVSNYQTSKIDIVIGYDESAEELDKEDPAVSSIPPSKSTASSPTEFTLEVTYKENEVSLSKTFDPVTIEGAITTYIVPDVLKQVENVSINFSSDKIISIDEIKLMGFAPKETDLLPTTPKLELDEVQARKMGQEAIKRYLEEKYSDGEVTKSEDGWLYTIRDQEKEVFNVRIHNDGTVELNDMGDNVVKNIPMK